jgi:hypothetical protein
MHACPEIRAADKFGKRCIGIEKDRLMVRLDLRGEAAAFARLGCQPMDFKKCVPDYRMMLVKPKALPVPSRNSA